MNLAEKENFNKIFRMYSEFPWLNEHKVGFEELIQLCKTESEQELICDLIKRFCYLNIHQRNEFCKKMVSYIFDDCNCDPNKTLIAAMAIGDSVDSSQSLINSVRVQVKTSGHDYVRSISKIEAIKKYVGRGRNQIVIVEEFIGSATKIFEAIEFLRQEINDPFDVYICAIAIMESGLEKLESENLKYYIPYKLKKGISGYDSNKEIRLSMMEELESYLNDKSNDYFPFGFKKSEALYYMQYGNAVNNMFPIFWWDKFVNGTRRKQMFVRAW